MANLRWSFAFRFYYEIGEKYIILAKAVFDCNFLTSKDIGWVRRWARLGSLGWLLGP